MILPLSGARYHAVLEVAHAADTLVITDEDLRRDHASEIRALLAEMERWDHAALEEDVHVRREHLLCGRCRAEVLAVFLAPPARPRRRPRKRRR